MGDKHDKNIMSKGLKIEVFVSGPKRSDFKVAYFEMGYHHLLNK